MGRAALMAMFVVVSEETVDPLPMLGRVMERNEPYRRQDDYILQVVAFLADDITVSSNVYLPNHVYVRVRWGANNR